MLSSDRRVIWNRSRGTSTRVTSGAVLTVPIPPGTPSMATVERGRCYHDSVCTDAAKALPVGHVASARVDEVPDSGDRSPTSAPADGLTPAETHPNRSGPGARYSSSLSPSDQIVLQFASAADHRALGCPIRGRC